MSQVRLWHRTDVPVAFSDVSALREKPGVDRQPAISVRDPKQTSPASWEDRLGAIGKEH